MLIPLPVPEVRRLLTGGAPSERQRQLAWSRWRRQHQATAQRCHTQRRTQTQPEAAVAMPVILDVPGTGYLTPETWAQIEPILPPQRPVRRRPANDHRRTLEGMVWVMHSGLAWREVPAHFGPWQTIHGRYQRWMKAGLWQQIVVILHNSSTDTLTSYSQ